MCISKVCFLCYNFHIFKQRSVFNYHFDERVQLMIDKMIEII